METALQHHGDQSHGDEQQREQVRPSALADEIVVGVAEELDGHGIGAPAREQRGWPERGANWLRCIGGPVRERRGWPERGATRLRCIGAPARERRGWPERGAAWLRCIGAPARERRGWPERGATWLRVSNGLISRWFGACGGPCR